MKGTKDKGTLKRHTDRDGQVKGLLKGKKKKEKIRKEGKREERVGITETVTWEKKCIVESVSL